MKQPKYYVAAALLGTALSFVASVDAQVSDRSSFLAWWDSTVWSRAHLTVPDGVERQDHVYASLPAYSRPIDLAPIDVRGDSLEVRVLHQAATTTWLLVVPWSALDTIDDLETCVYRSWLVNTAGGRPLEIEFSPYCAQTYGPDETFALYRLRAGGLPWVEFSTNGPACVPLFLIRFDEVEERFVLERDECGG